jgi:predicted fused transcriptional regulator/phosphomethylpyrimidine kinase
LFILVYEIFLKVLQECPNFTNFVVEMAEKAQIPGCLMNVVKMLDGRRKMEDVATPIL